MKKAALVALALLLGALLLGSLKRHAVRTEIRIGAPPERVWAVLTDFGAYGEWNPVLTAVEGPLVEGAELAVVQSSGPGQTMELSATLLRIRPPVELRWSGGLGGPMLLAGEHWFGLRPDAGGTLVEQSEDFRGLLLFVLPLDKIQRDFEAVNQALKRRAETRSAGSEPR